MALQSKSGREINPYISKKKRKKNPLPAETGGGFVFLCTEGLNGISRELFNTILTSPNTTSA